MQLYFREIVPYLWDMFKGLKYSVLLTIISMFMGIIIGLITCLFKMGKNSFLRIIANIYIEIIRNTPLLVQLYILYFGLSQFKVDLSPFAASSIAMIINAGAYIAEILRGGFLSVSNGLIEAGKALGMTKRQILFHVKLKLVFKNSFPGLVNQLILMFLFSSVTSTIAMPELTYVTFNIQSKTARVFEVFLISGVMYYVITLLSVSLLKLLKKKLFSWR